MKYIFTLLLCMNIVFANAQYSNQNSLIRKALVLYQLNSQGYYERKTDVMLEQVSGVENNYAYEKKAQNLYVLTSNANIVITLNDGYAKIIKNNKGIVQLKGDALNAEIQKQTRLLDEKYAQLNNLRTKHLKDSIQKAREDSIKQAEKVAALALAYKNKVEDYRRTHTFRQVPTSQVSLKCDMCDKSFEKDSVFSLGIANDSVYFITRTDGDLGLSYIEAHKAKIPEKLATNDAFRFHYEVFKDSLTKDDVDYDGMAYYFDYKYYQDYRNELKRIAPYGYFDGWGWNSEYSVISFNFRYA